MPSAAKKHNYLAYSVLFFLVIFCLGSLAFLFAMRHIQDTNSGLALSQTVSIEKLRLEAAINGEVALVLKMADSALVQRYFLNPDDPELNAIAFEELAGYKRVFVPKSIFWVNDNDKKFYFNDSYAYTVNPDDPASYWYNMTINGDELINLNINYNPELDLTDFWINAPVFGPDKKPIGVLGTGIDAAVFIDSVYRNYSGDAPLYYFNKSGEITGASDKNLVTEKVLLESHLGETGALIFSMKDKVAGSDAEFFNIPGGIAALVSIPEFDWYACAVQQLEMKDLLGTPMTILFLSMMVVIAAIIVIFNLIQVNFELNRERNIYKDMSTVDVLTGIHNRRFLEENLERIIKSLSRSGGMLSVMMIDVDYFKQYNDTYGHSMGDICLKTVATVLAQSVSRADDFVARYGGEEFVVVLPNVDENGTKIIAEKMLVNIRERKVPHEKSSVAPFVTISIGGMSSTVDYLHSRDEYLKRADEALYISKKDGRNRFTAAQGN